MNKKNLIIAAYSGDEVIYFGGLVLSSPSADWDLLICSVEETTEEYLCELEISIRNSCNMLGINRFETFNYPAQQIELFPYNLLKKLLQDKYKNYDNIYTYNIIEIDKFKQYICLVTTTIYPEINIRAMGGFANQIVTLDKNFFNKKLYIINNYYKFRIGRRLNINAFEIKNYEIFQRYKGFEIYSYYFEILNLPVYDFLDEIVPRSEQLILNQINLNYNNQHIFENPWEFTDSAYENERYMLELEVLKKIKWHSLVEIDACEGFFTKKIIECFPNNKITVYEPNSEFFKKISFNLGKKVHMENKSILELDPDLECDVLFISSVLYYIIPFPYNIFSANCKYIVLSHHKLYHEKVIDPLMKNNGFKIMMEFDLGGKIENLWNVQDIKEGTNIKVWKK